MRHQFSLFNSPIDLAHKLWMQLLESGDCAIDATCGNGKDSLALCTIFLEKKGGFLISLDIQETALSHTHARIQEHCPQFLPFLSLHQQSHRSFPSIAYEKKVKLIVYNLGYLPGGDKRITTLQESTLESLTDALKLISAGGMISLTCYVGHKEGEQEYLALKEWFTTLPSDLWSITECSWYNRHKSPILILLQKNQP